MVASKDGDAGRIADLEGNEKGHSLDGVVSTIDIVACTCLATTNAKSARLTHEQIVRVWVGAADAEELHQIMELAMNITTDCDWAFLQRSGTAAMLVFLNLPLVVHSTLLAALLSPTAVSVCAVNKTS